MHSRLILGLDRKVPYKGTGPAITDLLGGQIDVMFSDIPPALQHVGAGKLLALGVTSSRREAAAPEVAPVAESGVAGTRGFEAVAWQSLVAPGGTSQELIARYAQALVTVMGRPQLRARLESEGVEPTSSTPEQLAAYIRSETERWGKVVRLSGATVD